MAARSCYELETGTEGFEFHEEVQIDGYRPIITKVNPWSVKAIHECDIKTVTK